jgi:predicted RNase H-like HicB family nuclease
MSRPFTLEYWLDDSRYVGRLKEVSGVTSQGETLLELEENIRDAYQLVTDDTRELEPSKIEIKEIAAAA